MGIHFVLPVYSFLMVAIDLHFMNHQVWHSAGSTETQTFHQIPPSCKILACASVNKSELLFPCNATVITPSGSACYSSYVPNSRYSLSWKDIDGSLNVWRSIKYFDGACMGGSVHTFGGDKPMNGILVVVNGQQTWLSESILMQKILQTSHLNSVHLLD